MAGITVEDLTVARRGWILVVAGGSTWLLTEKTVLTMGMVKGSIVYPDSMNEKAMIEQIPSARRDTERFLSGSEHTAFQLRSYLRRRLYLECVTEDTLSWAERNSLISDERYSEIFIRSHSGNSPMGNFRIAMELRKRGVPEKIIKRMIARRDEDGLYQILVDEVKGRYGRLERQKALRRATSYLNRRGFSFDLTRRILEAALGFSDGRLD